MSERKISGEQMGDVDMTAMEAAEGQGCVWSEGEKQTKVWIDI